LPLRDHSVFRSLQPLQPIPFPLRHRDSFHPSSLTAVKRNFLLCSIRNFSLCRDITRLSHCLCYSKLLDCSITHFGPPGHGTQGLTRSQEACKGFSARSLRSRASDVHLLAA